ASSGIFGAEGATPDHQRAIGIPGRRRRSRGRWLIALMRTAARIGITFRHRFVSGGIRLQFQHSDAMTVLFEDRKVTISQDSLNDGPAFRFLAAVVREEGLELSQSETLEIEQGPE